MTKETQIRIFSPNNGITNCAVRHTDVSPWKISIDCGSNGVFESEAEDLFEAFINIRKQLRSKKFFLLCNGSRCNIYPSPMLRQTSGGEMAYLLRVGVPARREDVVSIFGPIEMNDVNSIEKQKEFYEKWLISLDPTSKEIEEASKHPNGWVYRIDGKFSDNEQIPPTSIIGAWEVNSDGKITSNFIVNKKYKPSQPV